MERKPEETMKCTACAQNANDEYRKTISKSKGEDFNCSSLRIDLDEPRRLSRIQMWIHLQNTWKYEDIYHLLFPYLENGLAYYPCFNCKKVVENELEIMKEINLNLETGVETYYMEAELIYIRTCKELLQTPGIEKLLASDTKFWNCTNTWVLDFIKNSRHYYWTVILEEEKTLLNAMKESERKMRDQQEKEGSRPEDEKGREEDQLEYQQEEEGIQPEDEKGREENQLEYQKMILYPIASKEHIRSLIEKVDAALNELESRTEINFAFDHSCQRAKNLTRCLEERLEHLIDHECQDNEVQEEAEPSAKQEDQVEAAERSTQQENLGEEAEPLGKQEVQVEEIVPLAKQEDQVEVVEPLANQENQVEEAEPLGKQEVQVEEIVPSAKQEDQVEAVEPLLAKQENQVEASERSTELNKVNQMKWKTLLSILPPILISFLVLKKYK